MSKFGEFAGFAGAAVVGGVLGLLLVVWSSAAVLVLAAVAIAARVIGPLRRCRGAADTRTGRSPSQR